MLKTDEICTIIENILSFQLFLIKSISDFNKEAE